MILRLLHHIWNLFCVLLHWFMGLFSLKHYIVFNESLSHLNYTDESDNRKVRLV